MIEDALRETFAAMVAAGGPHDDAGDRAGRRAEHAILRAVKARQRQALGTAIAGVLIVALASFATFQVITGPSPSPTATEVAAPPLGWTSSVESDATQPAGASPAAPMPIEVVSSGEVYTEGKSQVRLSLPDKSKPSTIWRASDGYLIVVVLPDAAQQLLLLDRVGNQSKVLLKSAQRIVVSPSGDKVAWLADSVLSVAGWRFDKTALDSPLTTPAPPLGAPIAFLGPNVVLSRTKTDGTGTDAFDLWYPNHDGYTQKWDTSVVRIFGARPDGGAMYAQVRDLTDPTKICFALLVPDQPFKVTAKTCGIGLPEPTPDGGGISPDGRWLAYPVANASKVAAVDLRQLFTGPPNAHLWNLNAASGRAVWLGPNSLVVDAGGKFVTLDPSQPTKQETAQGSSVGKVLIEPLRS